MTGEARFRVLIPDDHPLVREGILRSDSTDADRGREELEARLRDLRVSLNSIDTVDLNDVGVPGDSVSSGGVPAAVVEIISRTLQGIEGALERPQCGQYGVCAECGAEISAARLRAIPFAERCRDWQELADAHRIVLAG